MCEMDGRRGLLKVSLLVVLYSNVNQIGPAKSITH